MRSSSVRSTFLRCLGAIYLIAFWSYYTSFPGLLSSSGLYPFVNPLMYPSIQKSFVQRGYIDAESLCELAAVLGIALSCIAASGWIHHGLLFTTLTLLYCILTGAGGPFYSFQWDTLLLETGVIASVCYAPWTRLRVDTSRSSVGSWPLRFLLFKLMYMSGVVKIQADCPTWKHLTALEYHFATQCLPGPLAWHVHQLHPLFLRLSVAATLWIEIPCALLLLSPVDAPRRIGAILQIVLQINIICTGNYNFFNLLTICLCLVCLERDEKHEITMKTKTISHVVTSVFVAWTFPRMFALKTTTSSWWDGLTIILKLTKVDCDAISRWIVPVVTIACMALVLWQSRRERKPLALAHALVCVVAIGVIAMPMCYLVRPLISFWGSNQVFEPLWMKYLQRYRLVNGYGLFRRMTGVGTPPSGSVGWAGLPPSVVARPEIILEGVFEGEEKWTELNFWWKPGNVYEMPRQVAPHQPRLDWQMWFAALGNAQSNLWFVNLLRKLLENCGPVQDLVGDPNLQQGKLVKIRAKLYHYDFTRLDTEWNKAIPGVALVNATSILERPSQYWHRRFVRMYIGELTVNDTRPGSVWGQKLSQYGFIKFCGDRCRSRHLTSDMRFWCHVASRIREYDLQLLPLFFLFMSPQPF